MKLATRPKEDEVNKSDDKENVVVKTHDIFLVLTSGSSTCKQQKYNKKEKEQ